MVAVLRRQGASDGLLEEACAALRKMYQYDENEKAAGKEGAIGAVLAVLRKQGASDGLRVCAVRRCAICAGVSRKIRRMRCVRDVPRC